MDCLPVVVRADPLALHLSGGRVGDQAKLLQLAQIVLLCEAGTNNTVFSEEKTHTHTHAHTLTSLLTSDVFVCYM